MQQHRRTLNGALTAKKALLTVKKEKPMQRTVRHEVKLQKSVIIILGVLAFGVCANAFSSAFSVDEVMANHTLTRGNTPLGSLEHPLIIECLNGCN